jgi:hypothetical protein
MNNVNDDALAFTKVVKPSNHPLSSMHWHVARSGTMTTKEQANVNIGERGQILNLSYLK